MFNDDNMVMPVAPAYGNGMGGFGGWDSSMWIILIILFALGGWGGMGAGGGMYEFPWLLNGQNGINANTNAGFNNLATQNQITAVQSDLGDIQTQLCGGFAGVNATVNNGFANAETSANARQIANLQQAFNAQTAVTGAIDNLAAQQASCCCENRLATADLKYTIANEACQSRATSTANTQAILDKLCQLELDGFKRENDQLRSQLQFANLQASQVAQTAELRSSQATTANQLVSELRSCPIPSQPVYGNQPIFTYGNSGCGCTSF